MSFHIDLPEELLLLSRSNINTLILSGVSVEQVHQADQYVRTRLTLVGRKDPLDAVARELDNHKTELRYIRHDLRDPKRTSVNNFTAEPALPSVQATEKNGVIYLPLTTANGTTIQEPYSLLVTHPTTNDVGIALAATFKTGYRQPYYLPKANPDSFLSLRRSLHDNNATLLKYPGAEVMLEVFHIMKTEKLKVVDIVEYVTESLAEHVRNEYTDLITRKLVNEAWIYGKAQDAEDAGPSALTRPVIFLTLPKQQANRFLPLVAYLQHAEQAIKADDDVHPPFQFQLYDKEKQIVAGNSARFQVTQIDNNGLLSELPNVKDPFPYMLRLPNEPGTVGIAFRFADVLPKNSNDRFMQMDPEPAMFQSMQQLTTGSIIPGGHVVSLKIFCMDNVHGLNILKQLVVNGLRCEGRNVWERYRCEPLATEIDSLLSLKGSTYVGKQQSQIAQGPPQIPQTLPQSQLSQSSKLLTPVTQAQTQTQTQSLKPGRVVLEPITNQKQGSVQGRPVETKTTSSAPVKIAPIPYSVAAKKIQSPVAAAVTAKSDARKAVPPPPAPKPVAVIHKEEKLEMKANHELEKARLDHEAKQAARQIEVEKQARLAAAAADAKMKRAIEREAEVKHAQLAEGKRKEEQALKQHQAQEAAKLEETQKQEKKAVQEGLILPKQQVTTAELQSEDTRMELQPTRPPIAQIPVNRRHTRRLTRSRQRSRRFRSQSRKRRRSSRQRKTRRSSRKTRSRRQRRF